jgi:hypothetical protein
MVPPLAENVTPKSGRTNLKLYGGGSHDLQSIKKGRQVPEIDFTQVLQTPGSFSCTEFISKAFDSVLYSLYVEVLYTLPGPIYRSYRFPGARFDSITMSNAIDDYLRAKCNLKAQQCLPVQATKLRSTGEQYSEDPVAWHETYVKKASATIEPSAWTFTLNNNLKGKPVIRASSGDLIKYLMQTTRKITGELTLNFTSTEEAADVLADTSFDLEFGFPGSKKATLSSCKQGRGIRGHQGKVHGEKRYVPLVIVMEEKGVLIVDDSYGPEFAGRYVFKPITWAKKRGIIAKHRKISHVNGQVISSDDTQIDAELILASLKSQPEGNPITLKRLLDEEDGIPDDLVEKLILKTREQNGLSDGEISFLLSRLDEKRLTTILQSIGYVKRSDAPLRSLEDNQQEH